MIFFGAGAEDEGDDAFGGEAFAWQVFLLGETVGCAPCVSSIADAGADFAAELALAISEEIDDFAAILRNLSAVFEVLNGFCHLFCPIDVHSVSIVDCKYNDCGQKIVVPGLPEGMVGLDDCGINHGIIRNPFDVFIFVKPGEVAEKFLAERQICAPWGLGIKS